MVDQTTAPRVIVAVWAVTTKLELVALVTVVLAARFEADPFYAGQAMLGPQVRLGDLADAVVYFGVPQ